jgi:thiol:disulfide interchange protein DsbD
MKHIISLLVVILYVCSISILAQTPKVNIKAEPEKVIVQKGEKIDIRIQVKLPSPWYTYDLKEQISPTLGIGPNATAIYFEPESSLVIIDNIKTSKLHKKLDKSFEMEIFYFEKSFEFIVPVKAKENIDFSKNKIKAILDMQLCDTARCLPPEYYSTTILSTAYSNMDKEEVNATTDSVVAPIENKEVVSTQKIETIQKTESQIEIDSKKKEGFWAFLWFAMGAGALSLLTPCVFPMIPITVSFFTKRAEKAKTSSVKDAFVYAIGIMMTFTGLGILLAAIFGATGIRDFAANGWINLFITAIFIIFALNLFGAFEIQLPSGLMNKLNSKSSSGTGIVSVLLMALTFSITSFTCTVPFVGSTLIAASGGEWFEPIIGMVGFSAVFAAPFFMLALFPSAIKKLPKSGGWMNNVKVVMGFIEIAAALKFLSNADMVWNWGILPKELFLAIWIAICILVVMYILGIFRLHHDSPVESVKASRILWSIAFGSLAFYFLTGLFGKTLGELDAFLPPAEYRELMSSTSVSAVSNIKTFTTTNNEAEMWLHDYKDGLRIAKETGLPLFIDFTGFTCTNCRWMEQNMFKRNEIAFLMNEFVKVKLFTDRREEPYLSNKKLQQTQYGSIELPLYVIISPNGEFIGTKTFTRDINEFVTFLNKGIANKQ